MKEIISGKTVVFVGRAAYLAEKEQGDFIDSHDVVIRMHCNLPYPMTSYDFDNSIADNPLPESISFVPDRFHKYIGSRCDIYFTGYLHPPNEHLDKHYTFLKRAGIKQVVAGNLRELMLKMDGQKLLGIEVIRDRYMPVYITQFLYWAALQKRMGYHQQQMPGTLYIYELLQMEPKQFYATGFPCHLDQESHYDARFNESDCIANMKCIGELAQNNECFEIDSEMKELSATT